MTGLSGFLDRCDEEPDRTGVIDGGGEALSYGDLSARSATLCAAWRASGLNKGDRVLMAMPLGLDLYVALAALWRAGAVVVFPEPAMGLAGLRHAAKVTKPRAFLSAGLYRCLRYIIPELWHVPMTLGMMRGPVSDVARVDLSNDDPALISFTSGSTGEPKAIVRTHGLLGAQNESVGHFLTPARGPTIDLVAFPVFVLANLAIGNTSVLPNWNVRRHDRADPAAIVRQVKAHDITRLLVPPSICSALSEMANDLRIDAIFTGGGPVFPDLMRRLTSAFPGAEVMAVYGSTEAEPIAHIPVSEIADDDWTGMRDGRGLLAGRPVDETRVKIIGDEIVVTGDHVNKGYLDPSQDASTKITIDGEIWHRTGDAGQFDEAGRLWLLGRTDSRCGGLFPFAVETAARFWPGAKRTALAEVDGRSVLAIEGEMRHEAAWRDAAAKVGDLDVVIVKKIPLDRRHHSKVDYPALRNLLAQR